MINFRLRPDMFYCFPREQLAPFTDNSMPRRDWSKYDAPAKDRVNVAKMKIDRARRVTPALLRRQAS